MLPDISILLVIFFFAILVILVVTNYLKRTPLPFEALTLSGVFASLVIGFIVVYAIQKYDAFSANTNLYIRRTIQLAAIACKYAPEVIPLLVEYTINFACRRLSLLIVDIQRILDAKITDPIEKNFANNLINQISIANSIQADGSDIIPNGIWYAVFLVTIIISIFIIRDIRLTQLSVLAILVTIWIPLTVIYYIYITRDEASNKQLYALVDSLKKNPCPKLEKIFFNPRDC